MSASRCCLQFQRGLLPSNVVQDLLSPSMFSGDTSRRYQDSGHEESACCHHDALGRMRQLLWSHGLSRDWHLRP